MSISDKAYRPEGLLDLDQALETDKTRMKEYHNSNINPGLAMMMGLIGFDKQYVRAQGVSVWDSDGNEYLDFLGAYGALNLGHNHPGILEALDRVKEMPNLLQASLGTMAGVLARNLALITPGSLQRSFFCNSGTEAVEGALKLARACTGKHEFVYCNGSFHGKTMGSLSVTGREKYQKPFYPLLPGCTGIPYGDIKALEEIVSQRPVAAFILEPIQGEGGIIQPPPGYLRAASDLCAKYGVLLIADEVQTGFGRTGAMFACEHEGVVPDILCLAKSLGGGIMPIGACITTDDIWKKAYGTMEKATLHTSTFGGNTWAAAAAIATIDIIYKEDLVNQAREKGLYFLDRLNSLKDRYPLLKDARGKGLLIGIEFNQQGGLAEKITMGMTRKLSEEYLGSLVAGELLNKYGIITAYTLNNPNVIRLEPPLIVTYEQIDRLIKSLEEILSSHRGFISMAASGARTIFKSLARK